MSNTIDKIRDARIGHDSLGPTGLTVYLTPAERDEILAALIKVKQDNDTKNCDYNFRKLKSEI